MMCLSRATYRIVSAKFGLIFLVVFFFSFFGTMVWNKYAPVSIKVALLKVGCCVLLLVPGNHLWTDLICFILSHVFID